MNPLDCPSHADPARYETRTDWICRKCAGLSYASEGRALRINFGAMGLWGYHENHPRPELWELGLSQRVFSISAAHSSERRGLVIIDGRRPASL
jgi:hypothetical protein